MFLALTQTTNAVLIARGKAYYPLIGLIIGAIVKIVLELTLVSNPSLNIFGGGIALIACYFTICLLNLIILISVGVKNANKTAYNGQPVS